MTRLHVGVAAAVLLLAGPAGRAADLSKIDRTILKEPAYATRQPRYCLLVFGPEASARVWVVVDGDIVYVDRNGNGDLTEAGERVRFSSFRKNPEGPVAGQRDAEVEAV